MQQANLIKLANRVVKGDALAENQLYHYFKDEVEFLVKLKIGKNNPDWEDLCQEIFIAFFQRTRDDQYDSTKGTLGAFLQSTIKFKIMDYKKSPGYKRRHEYEDIAEIDVENSRNYPEQEFEDKQAKQILKDSIIQLAEPYKEILFLLVYKQLKVKEVSKKLNISEQKVSNLKSYALSLLKKQMI